MEPCRRQSLTSIFGKFLYPHFMNKEGKVLSTHTCFTGSRARSRIKDADDDRVRVYGTSRAEGDEALSLLLRSCLPLSFLPAFGDNL